MANEMDLDAIWQQVFQTLVQTGLNPGASLEETLEYILRLLTQPDGHIQPPPLDRPAASTMPEQANQAQPPPPPITPASSSSHASQLDMPTDVSLECPVCERSFGRPQERDHHVLTHLPYWLFCPFLDCPWRGDRSYCLHQHWTQNHADFGEIPDPEQCCIYNPHPLVRPIVDRELLIEEVTETVLQVVRVRAQELNKVDVWEDEWGRARH